MSRKTRRELRKAKNKKDVLDEITEVMNGPENGIPKWEIIEMAQYFNVYHQIVQARRTDIINYCISPDTFQKYKGKIGNTDSGPMEFVNHYLALFSVEAVKKGFEALITYVRFLKMTILGEGGVFRIVSEKEQRYAKRWVIMKYNLDMKYNYDAKVQPFLVELATPASKNVWEVKES